MDGDAYDGAGYNAYDGGYGNDDEGYGNDARTREFLAQPSSFFPGGGGGGGGGGEVFPDADQPNAGSSSLNLGGLGLESLDLNDGVRGPSLCGGAGGQLAANPSEDEDGVDQISSLPDDVLTRILLGLDDAAAAGRTSVLSSRWRRLWLLLPELRFPLRSDPRRVAAALVAHEAFLSNLSLGTLDADAESVAAWLPAVARRLTGRLSFTNQLASGRDNDDGSCGEERGSVELPCMESATSVTLDLGFGLGLSVAPAGVFARLTDVSLTRVLFRAPCALGEELSSPRCPCLEKLTIRDAQGLDKLLICSDSLREMTLGKVRGLELLAVASPALEYLSVHTCFIYDWTKPVAHISAPALKVLRWGDLFDPISVRLDTKHLETLVPMMLFVYGSWPIMAIHHRACLELLRCFKTIQCLTLTLAYLSNIDEHEYLMEGMTILPDIMVLDVIVTAHGHAFGASLFHVLRLCSGIKSLTLDLAPPIEVEAACLPGCICNEHEHWKTEELLLGHLQEIEVIGFRGSQHEVTLLKQLFGWAIVLKKITVTFDHSMTESMAKELCQMFRSFSRPETCLKFNMSNVIQLDGASSGEDGNNILPLNY